MSFKNLLQFKKRMARRQQAAEDNAKELITRASMLVSSRAINSILRDPKTGAVYGKHQASAAGEAPASDTGFLARSISHDVVVVNGEVVGMIKASAPYAPHLEFGTKHIAPRPFMQPALEQNRRKIVAMFKKGGILK